MGRHLETDSDAELMKVAVEKCGEGVGVSE